MKRIKAACICQTLQFILKENIPHDYAADLVKKEFSDYKAYLYNHSTKYKIIDETT